MSETSETKEEEAGQCSLQEALMTAIARFQTEAAKYRRQGNIDSALVIEARINALRAALNQPAPCGPGLTEADIEGIGEASQCLESHIRFCMGCGDYEAAARWLEADRQLQDLLARDAKADTVTLRREALVMVMGAADAYVAKTPLPLVNTRAAIAEAEAALPAKGGASRMTDQEFWDSLPGSSSLPVSDFGDLPRSPKETDSE